MLSSSLFLSDFIDKLISYIRFISKYKFYKYFISELVFIASVVTLLSF